MKNSTKGLLAALVFVGSIEADAAVIAPLPGIYSLSGTMILPPCSVTLTANVQYGSAGSVDITVTTGTVTGPPPCGSMSIVPPWTANIPASDLPLLPVNPFPVDFYGVTIITPLIVCSNPPSVPMQVIFSNGNPISNPSELSINTSLGVCQILGTMDTSAFTDVNIY